jgi:hypothetical protein
VKNTASISYLKDKATALPTKVYILLIVIPILLNCIDLIRLKMRTKCLKPGIGSTKKWRFSIPSKVYIS